nr:MAG TPA: hypothetical protein [Caudoviricetes sp.]DAK64787.1 MAG TPA: hypothetical protein [Caudoviricetes sp.]DAO56804.1 MAG TPA: hypothetical protein [Caudoviricetes sp.]DAQ82118.1 MAG TPA: hypothetical protein [Caudoviricetes sp.]DAX83229.1 MAG TPA: hypothetical protein [Caudoviricetes sp.]
MFVVCNIFSLKVLSHETYSWLLLQYWKGLYVRY